MNAAADHVFSSMSTNTVINTLLAVHGKDFGDAGALIESAGLAFLFRNGVDVGGMELARLPIDLQLRVLTSPDLWTRSEAERVRLVCATLRACRARMLQANINFDTPGTRSGLMALLQTGNARGFTASAARTALAAASAFRLVGGVGGGTGSGSGRMRRPGASGVLAMDREHVVPLTPPNSAQSAPWPGTSPGVAHSSGAAASPSSMVPAPPARPAFELSSTSGFSGGHGTREQSSPITNTRPLHRPVSGPLALASALSDVHVGDGELSPGALRGPPSNLGEESAESESERVRAHSSFSSLLLSAVELLWNNVSDSDGASGGPGGGGIEGERGRALSESAREPPLATAQVAVTGIADNGGTPGMGHNTGSFETGSLRDIEAAFAPAWNECRLMHLTPIEQHEATLMGEVPAAALASAALCRERATRRLALANSLNVRRLSELNNLPTTICSPEDLATWPAVRFGLEVPGVWEAAMSPLNENDPRSVSTERVYALGSAWSLDVKRYIAATLPAELGEPAVAGGEYLAVYLRRRLLPATGSPDGSETDTRDRTTVAFSIRLCGAPGAPTSNSVCGRSTMGKPFGTDAESSWGWEAYLLVTSLADRSTWTTGASLRFLITLDLV